MSASNSIPPVFRAPGIGRLTPWMNMPTPSPSTDAGDVYLPAGGEDDIPTQLRGVVAGDHGRAAHGPQHDVELQQMDFIYFQAQHEMLYHYRGDEHRRATLEALMRRDDAWGREARRFDRGLGMLEDRLAGYDMLSSDYRERNDAQIRAQMRRIVYRDVRTLFARLQRSPVHEMLWCYEEAITRAQHNILPLLETLVHAEISSRNAAAGGWPAPGPLEVGIRYRRPEELHDHVETGFERVTTAELVAVAVTVSSSDQIAFVQHILEERSIASRMVGEGADDFLEVVLPSRERLTVEIHQRG